MKIAELRQKISDAVIENSSDANNGQMSVVTEDSYSDLIDEILELVDEQCKAYKELVEAQEEYMRLLNGELEEVVPIAYNHGWRTSRFEQGHQAREKIAELKQLINDK